MRVPSALRFCGVALILLGVSLVTACGGGSSNGGGGGGGGGISVPAVPTGLSATAGTRQVSLTWNASSGASSYALARSATSGGPYAALASPSTTSYTDSAVIGGTTYYYVVAAVNSAGTSANSAQVSATPTVPSNALTVTVDVLSNRHVISPYVYGGAFPKDAATISDSGLSVVRWGGNAASTYNWQLGTDNADNDYFFEDFAFSALNNPADSNSAQFIHDVKAAGSNPLMTMVMMNWVAKNAETPGPSGNLHWSFSISKYGAQCAVDQFNSDAGNGLKSDCTTRLTASPNDAYFPLLDQPGASDPAGSVYRNQWAASLASAFGNTSSCPIPYSSITSCHFYDMDNEIDIWGGTHFDIHPNPSAYNELRDTYLLEARNLKTWDPAAVRLGPVSCCWWFYWNGANGNDKGAHAGVDFLPWWLNEVYWNDMIAGTRSLDIFDIHAYPDGPDTSNMTQAQKQAAAVAIYRDYWDPTLVSPSSTINQQFTTNIQPNKTIAFRIPRMRAIVNSIYPGTPLAFTEWSAAFAAESDFSTALGDADAYGILGRERMSLATRWTAPDPANPNYQALKLYTNYDGAHHGFAPISVSATHNADPNLFSAYAATNASGSAITLMVINKDPGNAAQVTFSLNGFSPSQVTSYTLSPSSPNSIVASATQAWSSTMSFAPYTATLLAISGSTAKQPVVEWDLNPDTIMIPAGATLTLNPKLISGSGTVTLGSPTFDSGITVTVQQSTVSSSQTAALVVDAGNTPGFYHFAVPAVDSSGVSTTQSGWIVVGNPPATLSKTGDNQTGAVGTSLSLSVTLSPGQSGGSAAGASVLFSTNAGALSNGTSNRSKVISLTNGSGVASVTLTLPSSAQQVQVQAEGPFALGHPVATFTETAQ